MSLAYTVRCSFTDPDVAERWLAWLRDPHLQDVLDAGAASATVVRLDGEPLTLEARYVFADRAAFQAYERDHAPRLRAEGLAAFPLELGLTYSRSVGDVVATCG